MAHNTTPLTGVEQTFKDDQFIVTKTDDKGVITYCNDICLKIAGYKEDEIVGQPHNILRSPDMPRCIFKLLWDTISAGDELLAYVTNKCKNGDHYWVLAHVIPSYDKNGNINGYLSSRRTATSEALDVIKPLYRELCAEEKKHSSPKESLQAGMDKLLDIIKEKNVSYNEFILSI